MPQSPAVGASPDARIYENGGVADRLEEMAALLLAQDANPYRAGAYRRAADTVRGLPRSIRQLFDAEGTAGLQTLRGVGRGISSAIAEILITGRWQQLERLRGTADPVALLQAIPGVGSALSRRIHDSLSIDTLEALEVAVHDGSLEKVRGVGRRRASAIGASVGVLLDRLRRPPPQSPMRAIEEPAVATLLQVDREYRERAAASALPTIVPRRFNPGGLAHLPVLHAARDGWHFTALYSNTARAHELGAIRDWVVIYFYDDEHHVEGRRTVVTETHGILTGKRVVRGRETECRALAAETAADAKAVPVDGVAASLTPRCP